MNAMGGNLMTNYVGNNHAMISHDKLLMRSNAILLV